jgi:hypothetical protein
MFTCGFERSNFSLDIIQWPLKQWLLLILVTRAASFGARDEI